MNDRACESVGIDLGTTYSSLAYVDRQLSPKMVLNDSGQSIIPSVVFFDDAEIIVGDMALEHARIDAERVVQFIKLHMGEEWRREFGGHVYTPEAISALILRNLLVMAEPQLGPVASAVITVPAFFNEKRRRATQQAGERAGVAVLGTLNEPMASTLAYGLHRHDREQTVLVYDLGGGTFNVTVVRISPAEICELATDGNRQLGGKDWDQALIDLVADDFMARYAIDPRTDRQGAQDLQLACEKAKRILSKKNSTSVRINVAGHDHVTEIDRATFEDWTRPLLEATRLTTEMVLSQAGLAWSDVSRIVPVGGSTLMPAVRALLTTLQGSPLETSVNPVMAVALGAAIYAHILETGKALKTVKLQPETPPHHDAPLPGWLSAVSGPGLPKAPAPVPPPARLICNPQGADVVVPAEPFPDVKFVTAHGVGIRAKSKSDGHLKNVILIPKNSRVPVKCSPRRFRLDAPSHAHTFVNVQITQGDTDDIAAAEILGEARIAGIPVRPPPSDGGNSSQDAPVVTEFVNVSLEFDDQGRLHMSAEYLDTARNVRQMVEMSLEVAGGLRPEEVEEQRQYLQELDFPRLSQPEF